MYMEADELDDEEWLTQYLSKPLEANLRDRPRTSDQGELSMIRGRLDPATARRRVRKGAVTDADGARYVQVRALRDAGFTVKHTPNPKNPQHVSVMWPYYWSDREASTFVSAFTEVVWHSDVEARIGGAENVSDQS